MRDPLGLSIGTVNFAAVRIGTPPMLRPALLILSPHRAPRLAAPAENPGSATPEVASDLLIGGFVEHVGERAPLVAGDGSSHRPAVLVADVLDLMTGAADGVGGQVAVGVPAYWRAEAREALQLAVRNHPSLAARGAPP